MGSKARFILRPLMEEDTDELADELERHGEGQGKVWFKLCLLEDEPDKLADELGRRGMGQGEARFISLLGDEQDKLLWMLGDAMDARWTMDILSQCDPATRDMPLQLATEVKWARSSN